MFMLALLCYFCPEEGPLRGRPDTDLNQRGSLLGDAFVFLSYGHQGESPQIYTSIDYSALLLLSPTMAAG